MQKEVVYYLATMRYLIAILSPVLFLVVSCGKMKEPVFNSIDNIRVNKLGLGKSQMSLDVQYFNPNHTKAKLKKAEGDAWIDSTYLGHFYVDTSINIPANSNFTIPVKLDVEMMRLIEYSLLADINQPVLITVKGKVRVGKAGVYRNIPLNYEGKQNLGELLKQRKAASY